MAAVIIARRTSSRDSRRILRLERLGFRYVPRSTGALTERVSWKDITIGWRKISA